VAAPADFITELNAAWIGEFLATYPQIRVEFVLSDSAADLIAESIDIAFRSTHVNEAQSVIYRRFEHYFVLAASPAYLDQKGAPRTVRDLSEHDCLAQGHRNRAAPFSWELKGPEGSVKLPIEPRFIANTAGALVQGALSGFGIALLPVLLSTAHMRNGRLIRVLPDYRRDGGGLKMVLPSRRQVPRAVAAFAEFAEARLHKHWL
jgi:DNA-binding transcriptional LysR family regulator